MSALVAFRSDPRLAPWHNRWLSGEPHKELDRSRAFTLRQYQNACVDAVYREWESGRRSTQVVMATGTGKASVITEPVLCPGGWRTMGDLRPGDYVIGSDGMPTEVLGVFPQGSQRVWRVVLNDGSFARCNAEHLWQVQTKTGKYRGRNPQVLTTERIRQTLHRGWQIPIVAPVQHDEVALPIDPYELGVLLGDGGLSQSVVTATTDDWIGEAIGYRKLRSHERSPYVGYWVPRSPGATRLLLDNLDLRARSEGKHVPIPYMHASTAQRLALLNGLMDTDGYPMPSGGAEFSSTSERLVDAVAELVRSLGGVARGKRLAASTFTYKGEKRQGQPAWRVNVKLPGGVPMFRLPRKAEAYVSPTKYQPCRVIRDVIDEGVSEEQVCIKVDAPDSLYVTRDHILTHNTVCFAEVARRCKGKVLIVVHREVLLQQTVEKLLQHTGDHVGIERASTRAFGEKFVVCTVQTASRRLSRVGLRREYDAVIIDESHHADTDHRYRLITDWFDKARVVCFTATPVFAEKLLVPESLAYYMDIKRATEEGWLVPLVGDRVEVEDFNLRDLRAWSHEFDEGEVPEFLVNKVAPIRDVLMDRYRDRRGILFTNSVREAYLLNEAINGIKSGTSVMVNATTPAEQRRELIKRLWKGRSRFFCNVGIAVEGFDWPQADLVLVGAETTWHAYVQKVGRVTRPAAGVVDGLSSASERRKAIAQSAKPNGLVLEVFRQGTTPDKLVQQGVSLEQAYQDGMRQIAEVMEISYRVEEKTERNAEQDEVRYQLQQARRPVVLIDSETVYNVSRFGVVDRFTEQLSGRDRTPGSANRINVPPAKMAEEEIVPKLPRLQLPRAIPGWEKLPPTERQARALDRLGVDVPRHATKQWASWALDVMTNRKWSIEIKHEQLKRIPVAPRRTR